MAKQAPWDDQTDGFISDIDATIGDKYKLSLRNLLLTPEKYLDQKDLTATVSGMRADVEAYFSDLLEGLKDEQMKLNTEMESANTQYKQVDSVITNKAAVARVPYIRPLDLTRDADKEEEVTIENYDETMDAFIGKLVNISNYVADVSNTYKDYRLGSWLFSGAKNYVLTINPPDSPVLYIENSSTLINDMLDEIETRAAE